MRRVLYLALLAAVAMADDEVVFRSDVSMMRLDVQALDRENRAITGLRVEDFVLREQGRVVPIRNFAAENMPLDLLFLIDVSGSMRPHVQRLYNASREALQTLGSDDRVGIMVFDTSSRLRLPFRSSRAEVEREMDSLLRHETFARGTDITRGMLDAAQYVGREGRREARRAIVILTDDQTGRERDDEGVERALTRADAVLSALLAPDAMRVRPGMGGGGGGWPGAGGGGPVILGPRRRYPYPNSPYPGQVGGRTKSAGTAEIARASGGDSMPVDDAYALERTLSRIRQRYTLYFYLPEGVQPGQERGIDVQLSVTGYRRHPDAEVRYRRVYLAPGGSRDYSSPEPITITRAPDTRSDTRSTRSDDQPPVIRRKPRGDMSYGPRNGPLDVGQDDAPAPSSGRTTQTSPQASPPPEQDSSSQGGWRKLKPGEKP